MPEGLVIELEFMFGSEPPWNIPREVVDWVREQLNGHNEPVTLHQLEETLKQDPDARPYVFASCLRESPNGEPFWKHAVRAQRIWQEAQHLQDKYFQIKLHEAVTRLKGNDFKTQHTNRDFGSLNRLMHYFRHSTPAS